MWREYTCHVSSDNTRQDPKHPCLTKISATLPIVIKVPATQPLGGETMSSFVKRFDNLNSKRNVCKQIS